MRIRKFHSNARLFCLGTLALGAALLPAMHGVAQAAPASGAKPPISLDEFFSYVEINGLALAPDGSTAVIGTQARGLEAGPLSQRPVDVARDGQFRHAAGLDWS